MDLPLGLYCCCLRNPHLRKGLRQVNREVGIDLNTLGGDSGVGPPEAKSKSMITLPGRVLVKAAAKEQP